MERQDDRPVRSRDRRSSAAHASIASGVRFSARWIVANRYPPGVSGPVRRARRPRRGRRVADLRRDPRGQVLHQVADELDAVGRCPSAARFSTAAGVGANSQRDRWSATTRLISSGIRRSNERRPASTWATGTPQLRRRRARRPASSSCRRRRGRRPAAVRRRSVRGRSASPPVCSACVPPPTPKRVVGPRQAQFGEEVAGHRLVVVLARCRRRSRRGRRAGPATAPPP